MHSDHSEIWTGIGALGSSAIAIYGWLYDIGLAQLFMFIAGACFSMFAQERLEKKRRKRDFELKMTEQVYGPLHKELLSILSNLRNFYQPPSTSLRNITKDFRFSLVEDKLSNRITNLQERISHYPALWQSARHESDLVVKEAFKKEVSFSVYVGAHMILYVPLTDAIFRDKTPMDYLNEATRGYQITSLKLDVGGLVMGAFSSEHKIQLRSKEILQKVRENPMIQTQRKEQEYLLEECKSIMNLIRKRIVL